MVQNIKGIGLMIKLKDLENYIILMEIYFKVTFRIKKQMDLENIPIQMALYIKEIG